MKIVWGHMHSWFMSEFDVFAIKSLPYNSCMTVKRHRPSKTVGGRHCRDALLFWSKLRDSALQIEAQLIEGLSGNGSVLHNCGRDALGYVCATFSSNAPESFSSSVGFFPITS